MSQTHRLQRADTRRAERAKRVAERMKYRDDITRLFHEGKTDEQIAAAITADGRKTSPDAVRKMRGRLHLAHPRGGYQGVPTDTAYVIREFTERAPKTDKEIANVIAGIATDVGRHPDTVRRLLRREGLVEKRRVNYTQEDLDRAVAMLDDGTPYHDVAEVTGVPYDTLHRKFPGRGVRPQDQWVYNQAKKLEALVGL